MNGKHTQMAFFNKGDVMIRGEIVAMQCGHVILREYVTPLQPSLVEYHKICAKMLIVKMY